MGSTIEEKENERRWLILRAKVSEENVKSAFRLFRASGIEPILIKGWAAALEYPEKYRRNFSDIDLSVAPEDYEKSLSIVTSQAARKLNIDLHCGLRHLDTRDWKELFQNSKTVSLDGVEIRILRAEDHLRVLCVHWLTDGGAYPERLLDIFYLLENNAGNFDWEICFQGIPDHRRDWVIKTLAVVHRRNPLDTSGLPFAAELNNLPGWFERSLRKEWNSETKLIDFRTFYHNYGELWKQIKLRLSPNAIQATVFMDGQFDESSRIPYQIGSFLKRSKISMAKSFALFRVKFGEQIKKR